MNLLTPQELVANYAKAGKVKAELPVWKMLLLGLLAGLIIALGCVVSSTAAHAIVNVGLQRLVTGMVFAVGLGMIVLLGAELFTGNCLMVISLLSGAAGPKGVLKNWLFVYLGNFAGGLLVAAGCAFFGQLDYSDSALAVYTIKLAAGKCDIPFFKALVFGFFCNFLVSMGALLSLTARDAAGRVIGAFLPVAWFVTAGFEHCIANMYYIPAGLFAAAVPRYAAKAAEAGLDWGAPGWGNFLLVNLVPVTIGNILGGAFLGFVMWVCYTPSKEL